MAAAEVDFTAEDSMVAIDPLVTVTATVHITDLLCANGIFVMIVDLIVILFKL